VTEEQVCDLFALAPGSARWRIDIPIGYHLTARRRIAKSAAGRQSDASLLDVKGEDGSPKGI
jgi:hypothetical protein